MRALALEPAKVSAAFDSDTSPSCSGSPRSPVGRREGGGGGGRLEVEMGGKEGGWERREEHIVCQEFAFV